MSLVSLSFDFALSALELREDTPDLGRWPRLSHFAPLALYGGFARELLAVRKGTLSPLLATFQSARAVPALSQVAVRKGTLSPLVGVNFWSVVALRRSVCFVTLCVTSWFFPKSAIGNI